MKFSNYLDHQIIPEWREKYVDYESLVNALKVSFEGNRGGDIEVTITSQPKAKGFLPQNGNKSKKQLDTLVEAEMEKIEKQEVEDFKRSVNMEQQLSDDVTEEPEATFSVSGLIPQPSGLYDSKITTANAEHRASVAATFVV